jgi:hypothetical protein
MKVANERAAFFVLQLVFSFPADPRSGVAIGHQSISEVFTMSTRVRRHLKYLAIPLLIVIDRIDLPSEN